MCGPLMPRSGPVALIAGHCLRSGYGIQCQLVAIMPSVHRPARRLVQLYAGLVLYGASMALQVRAGLGLDPWDVFHQGVADRTGLSFGTVVILTGAARPARLDPAPPAPRHRHGQQRLRHRHRGRRRRSPCCRRPARRPVARAMLLAGVGLNGVAVRRLHRRRARPRPARRPDDRPRPPHRRVGPGHPHHDRGQRAGRRRRPGRHGRPRHARLRALDRAADPRVPAAADGRGSEIPVGQAAMA